MHEPYFAHDTAGVHFQVSVDGAAVWAHVASDVLARRYGIAGASADWVAVYRAHRREIDACAARLAQRQVPEIVIVRLADFTAGG